MSVERRVEKLEEQYNEALDAAYARLLSQLSNDELEALAGHGWEGLTDAEVEAVRQGLRPAPPAVAEYEPPPAWVLRVWELATRKNASDVQRLELAAWVLRRVWELATPEERRLFGLEVVNRTALNRQ